MTALYNEIEPYAAQWIKNLVAAGHVAPGSVDERSIRDLRAADVAGAAQFHAFAGIAVWSATLRDAGWPDDRPVWTGSCPCQPFSSAGRRRGNADERHLWPTWFGLIRECRPPIVFGEQVASPDGRAWLDAVLADLEGAGYACGAANLSAAGVGAPHVRQRLYFVAILQGNRWIKGRRDIKERPGFSDDRADASLADDDDGRREGARLHVLERGPRPPVLDAGRDGEARVVGDTNGGGGGRDAGVLPQTEGGARRRVRREPDESESASCYGGPTNGFWNPAEWISCTDGKSRPVEPGTFPLAHGVVGRVGKLRAYGNAIVRPLASTFIRAVMEIL